jgi:hypothetical protein
MKTKTAHTAKVQKQAGKLLLASLAIGGIVTSILLMSSASSTDIYPKAAMRRDAQFSNPNSPRTTAMEALRTTPVVQNKAGLLELLQAVDRTDVSEIARGLSDNERDSANL